MQLHRIRPGWKLAVLTTAKTCRSIKVEVTEAISLEVVITTAGRQLQKNTMIDRVGRGIMKVEHTQPARMQDVIKIRKGTIADQVVTEAMRNGATSIARSQDAIKAQRVMVDREMTTQVTRGTHPPVDMDKRMGLVRRLETTEATLRMTTYEISMVQGNNEKAETHLSHRKYTRYGIGSVSLQVSRTKGILIFCAMNCRN